MIRHHRVTEPWIKPIINHTICLIVRSSKSNTTKGLIELTQEEQQTKEMQTILQMFSDIKLNQQRIESTINLNQNKLENKMEEINQKIVSLGNQVTEISQKVQENASQIEQLDKKIIGNQKDLKRLEEERGKDHETVKLYKEATLILEMERASHTLRFRNIQEDKDVETPDLMEQALADFLDKEKSQMSQEIDQIYRVNSSFARKNKVPREVHVVFVRRKINTF
ncbi:hypothetical protein JRQ81_006407 [Phrynocephalus forsythii]|uniref:Uncharacterized protein n=1 Tax=Phrynocephalus forsythii TaxID=171643 RepID=A0A9Q0XHY2_9SAUR|nr:hypothetical protein JRQ81_006407 [Phrynocephalus forsythii]